MCNDAQLPGTIVSSTQQLPDSNCVGYSIPLCSTGPSLSPHAVPTAIKNSTHREIEDSARVLLFSAGDLVACCAKWNGIKQSRSVQTVGLVERDSKRGRVRCCGGGDSRFFLTASSHQSERLPNISDNMKQTRTKISITFMLQAHKRFCWAVCPFLFLLALVHWGDISWLFPRIEPPSYAFLEKYEKTKQCVERQTMWNRTQHHTEGNLRFELRFFVCLMWKEC